MVILHGDPQMLFPLTPGLTPVAYSGGGTPHQSSPTQTKTHTEHKIANLCFFRSFRPQPEHHIVNSHVTDS